MKRVLCLLMVCILAILLVACAPEGYVPVIGATPTPGVTPSPSPKPTAAPTATPAPTPVPTATPVPAPENVSMFTEFIAPGEDTVVIANSRGLIIGGYSNGVWLSHSQAAAYCGGRMTFYERSLDGISDTISSGGIVLDDSLSAGSVTASLQSGVMDHNSSSYLDIRRMDKVSEHDTVLYYCPKDRIPKARGAAEPSQFLPIIQGMLDAQFGAGAVLANIHSAYSLDIDSDGINETIINASNTDRSEYAFNSHIEYSENWYSIICVVEESGMVRMIEQHFSEGYLEDSVFACVRGAVDMDGDGTCEVIVEFEGYEWWGIAAYRFDAQVFSQVFNFSMGT